jgi:hypothetical protein
LIPDGLNTLYFLVSGYLKREAKAVAYWMHRDQRVSTALFNFSQILEHNTIGRSSKHFHNFLAKF